MTHSEGWSPYAGSSSIILAVGLLIVTGVLIYFAIRLHHPIAVKRPGKVLARCSRGDLGGMCDSGPGGIGHLRPGVVSAGRGSFDCPSRSHHSCYIDYSSGGLFRDCVPGKTEAGSGSLLGAPLWERSLRR